MWRVEKSMPIGCRRPFQILRSSHSGEHATKQTMDSQANPVWSNIERVLEIIFNMNKKFAGSLKAGHTSLLDHSSKAT